MESDAQPPRESALKISKEEGIEKINNKSVPIMIAGKVSGSNAVSAVDFAFLMQ